MMWIGAQILALGMAAGPLAAQTVSLNASTFFTPCSSAKAVHDMRCPNYTGFTSRLGGDAGAHETERDAAAGLSAPQQPSLGLRGGRDLQRGIASWYGPGFHGRTTANGEKFDMHELTAAHKTLPFGTRVRVTNLATNKSVVVRVNDRGPTQADRIGDLSYAAARQIRMLRSGVTNAKLEVLGKK